MPDPTKCPKCHWPSNAYPFEAERDKVCRATDGFGCLRRQLSAMTADLEAERARSASLNLNFTYVLDVLDVVARRQDIEGTWQERVEGVRKLASGEVKGLLQLRLEKAEAEVEQFKGLWKLLGCGDKVAEIQAAVERVVAAMNPLATVPATTGPTRRRCSARRRPMPDRHPMKRFAFYCRCGAAWRGDLPADKAAAVERVWRQAHDGDGHGPCDAAAARRARARSGGARLI